MSRSRKLSTADSRGTRLEKLHTLAAVLAKSIDAEAAGEGKNLAQMARQYRETIKEIEEIEEAVSDEDEIGQILSERSADGKPGAVRKDRSKLQVQ